MCCVKWYNVSIADMMLITIVWLVMMDLVLIVHLDFVWLVQSHNAYPAPSMPIIVRTVITPMESLTHPQYAIPVPIPIVWSVAAIPLNVWHVKIGMGLILQPCVNPAWPAAILVHPLTIKLVLLVFRQTGYQVQYVCHAYQIASTVQMD